MRSWLVVSIVAMSACFVPGSSVTGALHANGGSLGTWDFVPNATCKNGHGGDFIGVDLSDGVRAVRFLQDPSYGYTLVIATNGDLHYPTAVYHAADCATFQASLSTDIDDDYDAAPSGGFTVACPSPAPNTMTVGLQGAIEFAYCDAGAGEGS